jgi:hypothetical protein
MRGCARFIAFVGLLLFVISAVSSVLLLNARDYLLSPETYTQGLREAQVYDQLPAALADQMRYGNSNNPCLEDPDLCGDEAGSETIEDNSLEGMPRYFSSLPDEVWEAVIVQLLDPSWLEAQGSSVLDQIFTLLTEGPRDQQIFISFTGIKERVKSEAGYKAVLEVLQAQPDCSSDQLLELIQSITSGAINEVELFCNPGEADSGLVEAYIRAGLSQISGTIPPFIELDLPQAFRDAGSPAATALAVLRVIFQYAPWMALFWLLWMTVFAVRDVRSWLRWWGDGFFITGLSLLIIGFAAGPFWRWSTEQMIIARGATGFAPKMLTLVLDVFNIIVEGFSQRILTQAGVILGLGLLLLLLRLFTASRPTGEIGTKLKEPRSYT